MCVSYVCWIVHLFALSSYFALGAYFRSGAINIPLHYITSLKIFKLWHSNLA